MLHYKVYLANKGSPSLSGEDMMGKKVSMEQTALQPPLTRVYAGWDLYQQLLIEAIAPLTPEQLTLRHSPLHWSVGMLATHIISTRVWWFHYGMDAGSASIAPLETWDKEFVEGNKEPTRSAAELVAGLEQTWQMIEEALTSLTVADLETVFPHPHGGERPGRSRQWIIWHVLEHDIHHGGEISNILGGHGLAPVNIT